MGEGIFIKQQFKNHISSFSDQWSLRTATIDYAALILDLKKFKAGITKYT